MGLQPTTETALIAIGVLAGLAGIIFLCSAVRRRRTVGALLFPLMPSIIFFAVNFQSGSTAALDYIVNLGGPIAAYAGIALVVRRFVGMDIAAEETLREFHQIRASEAKLRETNAALNQELGEVKRSFEELREKVETSRPQPLPAGTDWTYFHPDDRNRTIVIWTGGIGSVRDVDVVVNSENVDMQLPRIYDPSISGTLRYLDAELDAGRHIEHDWLAQRLQDEITKSHVRLPVMPGTVFATPTANLAKQGIKYVFHVAAARGSVGAGYTPLVEDFPTCIQNCYAKLGELSNYLRPVQGMRLPAWEVPRWAGQRRKGSRCRRSGRRRTSCGPCSSRSWPSMTHRSAGRSGSISVARWMR